MTRTPKKRGGTTPQPPRRRRPIKLKAWRKYRGMSQEQLAAEVGMSVSNISQLEQGRQGYSEEGLEAFARVLRCLPGQILDVDPTKDEAIWSVWGSATDGDRKKILEIARTITGKAGD